MKFIKYVILSILPLIRCSLIFSPTILVNNDLLNTTAAFKHRRSEKISDLFLLYQESPIDLVKHSLLITFSSLQIKNILALRSQAALSRTQTPFSSLLFSSLLLSPDTAAINI
jgi:hypothetical protein